MKHIAIVAGGDSSEYEVSLKSAQGIYNFIDRDRYHAHIVLIRKGKWTVQLPDGSAPDINKNDFSFTAANGHKIKFDFAYITIHGRPGEDGRLQGYFDMLEIPYSSCGVLAAALTSNKYMTKRYLQNEAILTADSIRLTEGEQMETEAIIRRLKLPVFVKPNDGGSSFGVTKVKEAEQMQPAIRKAFTEGREVLIERFIKGTEVTCGCYRTKTKQVVFPITEVVTHNEFFDFDAKYNGEVEEITPARIESHEAEIIRRDTLKICDLLGIYGFVRVDYIIPENDFPMMLEVNTTPGMTATSFIPQQVAAAGLDIKEVLTDIIENR
jgi:D-alanine-D-alanine ligase